MYIHHLLEGLKGFYSCIKYYKNKLFKPFIHYESITLAIDKFYKINCIKATKFKFKSFYIQVKFSEKMHPIQIRLTRELIEKIDKLIERGLYPNRSEAVRDAVRRLRILNQ